MPLLHKRVFIGYWIKTELDFNPALLFLILNVRMAHAV